MSITSLAFLLFCGLLAAAYFVLPKACQWVLLLLFSLYFYTRSGWAGLIFLLITASASWLTALWMEHENAGSRAVLKTLESREKKAEERARSKSAKRMVFILLCFLIYGIWIVLKYSPMILSTVQDLFPKADLRHAWKSADSFIIPLGLSFYTFNAAGYVIDVSRKKYPAEKNFFRYLTFISFFPHIIQGPFSRFDRLGESLFARHSFDYDRMGLGLRRMLFGYAEKLLVADKLSAQVSTVMAAPQQYPGIYLIIAVLGYGVQLYADFKGYMDIMCGFCQILGIELEENFRQPYFSVSIQNYWTRWHMTLGHWYTDYIFYPASMGQTAQRIGRKARSALGARMGKLIPSYFAMIFVWTLTGLWHGANWTFVVWGWLNFAFILFSMQAEPLYNRLKKTLHINDKSAPWKLFMILRTILLVSLLRIFYCAPTVSAALLYIRNMFVPNWGLLSQPGALIETTLSGTGMNFLYIVFVTLCIFIVDLVKENEWKIRVAMPLRAVFYGLLFCMILIGSGAGNASEGGFLYAQF